MKSRVHTIAGVLAASALMMGCGSSILLRPAIDNVKKVGLISVSMNRDFYNIKAAKASESQEALKTLGRMVTKKIGILDKIDSAFSAEYLQIVSYAVKKYSEQLDGVGNLSWVPLSNFLQNPQYQDFINLAAANHPLSALTSITASIKSADWYTAPNMIHIPADAVVEKSGGGYQIQIRLGDAKKDDEAEFRKELGKLCGSIGVDAVAIIQLDMAYQKPGFSFSLGSESPATPMIASTLILVNKDGEVAVNTGLFEQGQGEFFEGEKITMLRHGDVFLNDKSVNSYCQAIEKACLATKDKMIKDFKKIK